MAAAKPHAQILPSAAEASPSGTVSCLTYPSTAWIQASSPALFLAGKGNITRDFAASTPSLPGVGPDEYAVKLVPNKRHQEFDWLILVVARGTLELRRLVTTDSQGGTSTFVFSHFRENVKLPDGAFTFRIPRGVEVIDGSRSR